MASIGFTTSLTTLRSANKFPTLPRESRSSTSSVCAFPKPSQTRRNNVVRASLDDAAKKGYEAAKEGVAEINKEASAAADNIGKQIGDAAAKVQKATEEVAGDVQKSAEGAWDSATENAEKAKKGAADNVEATADATKAAAKDAAAKVDSAAS